jgi:anti-sigma B factor antagonist
MFGPSFESCDGIDERAAPDPGGVLLSGRNRRGSEMLAATGKIVPENAGLTVDSRVRTGRTWLVLVGELDLATMPVFADALASALAKRPVVVELDLTGLGFIDARGIDAIAAASARMSGWGGLLAVRHAHGIVQRLFDLCGLDDVLVEAGGEAPTVDLATRRETGPPVQILEFT